MGIWFAFSGKQELLWLRKVMWLPEGHIACWKSVVKSQFSDLWSLPLSSQCSQESRAGRAGPGWEEEGKGREKRQEEAAGIHLHADPSPHPAGD
jgi:hypothetical protein